MQMSGGVFNITVDGCLFGTDGSDYAGIHLKAPQPRGGSIHSIRVLNSQFHLETSTRMQMPFSVSMFYGGSSGPAPNASATPKVCLFIIIKIKNAQQSKRSSWMGSRWLSRFVCWPLSFSFSPFPGGRTCADMVVPSLLLHTTVRAAGQIYDILFSNLTVFLADGGAAGAVGSPPSDPSFQFLGLPESLLRDFRFEDVALKSGRSHGWQCNNVDTKAFSFKNVDPMPTQKSGCL